MDCNHSGYRSGAARYLPSSGRLRLVVVCDSCGAELRELGSIPYRPQPRLLYIHLVELAARRLGLPQTRVAQLRLVALTGGEAAEPSERQLLALCRQRAEGGQPSPRPSRYRRRVLRAVELAWAEHDHRLDRAA